jgi:hypothetical protein
MKHRLPCLLLACLISILALLMVTPALGAKPMRQPVRAGSFYPADPSELAALIDRLTLQARQTDLQPLPHKTLKALIMPHAGYIYSGWTAAHADRVLSGRKFKKIILLGPDHFIGFSCGAISDVSAYNSPFGPVKLHPDAHGLRENSPFFRALPQSDRKEHSLEVVLPFLQRYLPQFELVPVVVGRTDPAALADALDGLLDAETLLVISSDLSHYLPYQEARARDNKTISWILDLNSTELTASQNRACGAIPIAILINLARRYHWRPVLLHYSNSGDTAGGRSRVVGYATIAFFGDSDMQQHPNFSELQGQLLVKLARHTIMEKLGQNVPSSEKEALIERLQSDCYQVPCGTFVTLKRKGQLRGCIGNLVASEPIVESVKRNALNAAFGDPRFSPLTSQELEDVDIEISVLSEPQPLEYKDGADLISKLRKDVDGVIIRKGHASATFLPQVWEQLPKAEDFLSHLCMKAGLPSDAWRDSELEVSTYQVQYFEESH